MSRKLTYFDVPGYAEGIRYMLHYGGLEFEDFRYDVKDWPNQEVKNALPYGQLPIYEENGRTLNQSMAIARYVAGQVGLLPSDPFEQAKLDAAVLNIYDFYKKMSSLANEEEEKKKALQEEAISYYFSRFERDVKAGNGYLIGKLSWGDFVLAATIYGFNFYQKIAVDDDYPTLKALKLEISELPGVKKYIELRKKASDLCYL